MPKKKTENGKRKGAGNQNIFKMSGGAAKRREKGEAHEQVGERLISMSAKMSGGAAKDFAFAQVGEKRKFLSPDEKLEKSAKVRAAARAVERANFMSEDAEMEIFYLKNQLEELNEDTAVEAKEYDIIIDRLKQLEVESKKKATEEANETETFTCPICFNKQALSTLRLIVPCGHGFCDTCTSNLQANIIFARRARNQDIPGCYNCRGQVTSVLKAYLD